MIFMKKRVHLELEWSVVRSVIYFAVITDFNLFIAWFFVPIAAIRISGLILAVIFGAFVLFQWRLSLSYRRKLGSVAAAFEAIANASIFFTVAVLFGLLKGLSPATAFGIYFLVLCMPTLSIIFFHRRDEKPWWVAVEILTSLGVGAFGIFLIYAHPPFTFTLYGALNGMLVFIGSLIRLLIEIKKAVSIAPK